MAGNSNSGRRKHPTALTLLRGNPGRRRINPDEPQPPAVDAAFDVPPAELAGNARAEAEWRRLAPLLRDCGLVSQADRSSLTALCLEWSTYLQAQVHLRRSRLVKTKSTIKVSPYVILADRALAHCARLWSELGMTPSGRARVSRTSARPATPVSKWGGLV